MADFVPQIRWTLLNLFGKKTLIYYSEFDLCKK